jgi:hypothetical protein
VCLVKQNFIFYLFHYARAKERGRQREHVTLPCNAIVGHHGVDLVFVAKNSPFLVYQLIASRPILNSGSPGCNFIVRQCIYVNMIYCFFGKNLILSSAIYDGKYTQISISHSHFWLHYTAIMGKHAI